MAYRLPVRAVVIAGVSFSSAAACADSVARNESANSGERLIVQSHRGAGNLAPENTLYSFRLAWRIGSVPEADIRQTRDGVIAPFHDTNFRRVAPEAPADILGSSIGDLDWDVVKTLDVGSYKGREFRKQRIPQFTDVLDAMAGHPERSLYMDVKQVSLDQLAELVRERGLDEQVILASTRYEEIRKWKALLPRSGTLLWLGEDQEGQAKRLEELEATGFADVTQLQLHVRVGDTRSAEPFAPSSEFIRATGNEIRKRDILFQVLVIGSNDPTAYKRLMDLGVESFATDDPLVTLSVMRSR